MKPRLLAVSSFLIALSVVATPHLAFGQANEQTVPSGTEVLIPDGTLIRAELSKGLDANKVHVGDAVKMQVTEDLRNPVTRVVHLGNSWKLEVTKDAGRPHTVLVPKGARLLAKVSYVDSPQEKKQRAAVSIAIVGAEWKGGFAKLAGLILTVMPEPIVLAPPARPVLIQGNRPGTGSMVYPRGSGSTTTSTSVLFLDGKVVFDSPDRLLRAGTQFYIEHRVPDPATKESRVPDQPDKVFESYRGAAMRGEPEAQFQLGSMYYRGEHVALSFGDAAQWYSRAAEQGHPRAQNDLAVMYAEGQGVAQDYVIAYMWFSLASAAQQDKNIHNLQLLESRMTQEQVAEGKRRAEEWLKQHPPSH